MIYFLMGVNEWYQAMERAGEVDIPVVSAGGRMLTPRQVLQEINGPLGAEIKRKMGW